MPQGVTGEELDRILKLPPQRLGIDRIPLSLPEERLDPRQGPEGEIESRVLKLVKLDGALLREANEIMFKVHPVVPLRSLDAIHLAAYGAARAGPLFSTDQRMVRAALALGYDVIELPLRAG